MDAPNLILSIDDGPKKGDIIDCRPGCLIRIGRVVRGNNLAIKDSGISHKHLIVEFDSDISQWVVTDLGSSNGTNVNGTLIFPNTSKPLNDGDIIKIGGSSSMSVKICTTSSAPETRTRRGRGTAAAGVCLKEDEVVEEERVEEPSKRMAVEGKKGKAMRASSVTCSTKSTKEQDVKNNADEATMGGPNGLARRKRSGSSARSSRNIRKLEPVLEGNCQNVARAFVSTATVSKDVQEGVEHDNIDRLGNVEKGIAVVKKLARPARVSRKDAILEPQSVEQKIGMGLRTSSMACSTRVMSKVEEQGETSERMDGLDKEGGKGRVRAMRDGGSARVSRKVILDPMQVESRRGRVTRASTRALHRSTLVSGGHEEECGDVNDEKVEEHAKSRGKVILEPVQVESRRGRATRASTRALHCSALVSERLEEECEVKNDVKVEECTKNRGKVILEPLQVESSRRRATRTSTRALHCSALVSEGHQEECEETNEEKAEEHAKNRRKVILDPVQLESRRGRPTRASTRALHCSALVSEGHGEECKEMKDEKMEYVKHRGKQKAKGRRGGRSTRISNKCEAKNGSMIMASDAVLPSSPKVSKELQLKKMTSELNLNSDALKSTQKKISTAKNYSGGERVRNALGRKVCFEVDDVENFIDNMMIPGEFNETEGNYFNGNKELSYCWSSFSKLRGIPNTTSKYREDRTITCHATPFEARVEKALNRGSAEASTSTGI